MIELLGLVWPRLAVFSAVVSASSSRDPSPWRAAPDFAGVNASFIQAWRAIVLSLPSELDPAVRLLLDRLAADEVDLMDVVRGEALLQHRRRHRPPKADGNWLGPGARSGMAGL